MGDKTISILADFLSPINFNEVCIPDFDRLWLYTIVFGYYFNVGLLRLLLDHYSHRSAFGSIAGAGFEPATSSL